MNQNMHHRAAPGIAAVVLGLTVLVAGCAQQTQSALPKVSVESETTQYRNEVTATTAETEVRFRPGGYGMMAADEAGRLDDFLRSNAVSPSARVTLWAQGTGAAAAAVRDRLIGYGIRPANIVVYPAGSGDRTGVQVVRLQLEQYQVRVPECGDWRPQASSESATPGFGCATVQALGLMVADPKDLVVGQRATGVDAQPQVGAMERYRTDKTTPLLNEQGFK